MIDNILNTLNKKKQKVVLKNEFCYVLKTIGIFHIKNKTCFLLYSNYHFILNKI